MPRKRTKSLSRTTSDTRRKRNQKSKQQNELTPVQQMLTEKQKREKEEMQRHKKTINASKRRQREDSEHRTQRLKKQKVATSTQRESETSEQRGTRLRKKRVATSTQLESETSDQRVTRLRKKRVATSTQLESETSDQRVTRLRKKRVATSTQRESETSEQRGTRLRKKRVATSTQRESETSEQRGTRLRKKRVATSTQRESETSEQRGTRLREKRVATSTQRESETSERRDTRLRKKRVATSTQRQMETSQQYQARLKNKRTYASNRRRATQQRQHGLGAKNDTSEFLASEFTPRDIQHDLPSLFDTDICTECRAYRWKEERPGTCCQKGRVKLEDVPEPPDEIKQLYRDRTFIENIRSYNNSLALASIGCQEIKMPGFSPTFKLQGKVYHTIGALLPTQGNEPKFAQLYFYDTQHETTNRLKHNPHLSTSVLSKLQKCIHIINPYVQSLRAAIDYSSSHPDVKLVLNAEKKPTTEHARRYNLPTASDVAVLMPGEQAANRDVIFQTRGGTTQRISELHRSYDPLHYVVPFPHGTDGYHLNIRHASGKGNVSPQEFYRYRIQVRDTSTTFNQLMKSRRLLQQYICDQFAKVESQRLHWARSHQKEIRAEKYQALLDAVDANDEVRAGTKVILPPTIYGSPRWYAESFQDAMAIVRVYGKPDLFVTFTCNPSWPEIKNSLFNGEHPSDRPDLCVRVFHIKLEALLEDLTQHNVLGRVKAYTGMKEDQKRGLPHCHILLTLSAEDKPREPADINRIVSAEIPDKARNPRLWEIITHNNIHGPCGNLNVSSPCMGGDGPTKICQKDFPKRFCSQTTLTDKTYPMYRRRSSKDGGHSFVKPVRGNHITIDNQWVVPYNPFLSIKYNAHINVEVVHSVSAVKYLYKYITKGSDRVMVRLADGREKDITHDEIERFINARYIGAAEACWRLLEFQIQYKYPPVAKLPLHLEDQQTVLFQAHEAGNIASQGAPTTKLTAYFNLNQTTPEARGIIYPDIFKSFRYTKNRWVKRRSDVRQHKESSSTPSSGYSDMLGRIPVINLSARQSELYYLRMLLYHKAGATSFADLRTINGREAPTYQAACKALSLITDDTEIDKAMEEAASIRFGPQLRSIFATLLIFISPADPQAFWERHKKVLCEDLMHRDGFTAPTSNTINEVLTDIQDHLQRAQFTLADFNLPLPDDTFTTNKAPRAIREETQYNVEELARTLQDNLQKFNNNQRQVYDVVMESVEKDSGNLISVDAPGGTGKTFLLTTLLAAVRSTNKIALATATSGIAATLLPNGRTLHSRCKVPINITDTSTCHITKRDSTAQLIRQCSLLVIDEVTMAHRRVYEAVDRTFQDIRESDQPFGGMTVVFAGDWRQILPVVPRGGRPDVVEACLKTSPLWQKVNVMTLTKNMRVELTGGNFQQFADHLLQIGEGRVPITKDLGPYKIQLQDEFVFTNVDLSDLCKHVYPDLDVQSTNAEWLCSRAILCPKNDDVAQVNTLLISKFPGQQRVYLSADKVLDDDQAHQYPTEFLNSLNTSGLPPHRLELKVGCPIMLLRNIDPANGHCNGSRYVINCLHDHVIEAVLATGIHAGKRLLIPRIPITPTDNLFPFRMHRRQFPIRLCFGMTSNKAQGQTLKQVGIYIQHDFFSHGQLYVAMSRVGDPTKLQILAPNGVYKDRTGTFVNNVVYHEIL